MSFSFFSLACVLGCHTLYPQYALQAVVKAWREKFDLNSSINPMRAKTWLNRLSTDSSPSYYANSKIIYNLVLGTWHLKRPLLVIFNLINILTVTLLVQ